MIRLYKYSRFECKGRKNRDRHVSARGLASLASVPVLLSARTRCMESREGVVRERRPASSASGTSGFTLLEVMIASMIFALLAASMYSVFYGALKLREKTYEAVEAGLPKDYIVSLIKRDMTSIMAPVGLLAGAMIGEIEEEDSFRRDTLEFYTASGVVNDYDPWGDIQKVEYYLTDIETSSGTDGGSDLDNLRDRTTSYGATTGSDLVRVVTRNLLASTVEEPEEVRLFSDVESLEFSYYDGEYWQDSWDSTVEDNECPEAVLMRIDFFEDDDGIRPQPIELMCEIVSKPAQDQTGGDA